LSAGLYNVAISDSKGCVSSTSIVNIFEPTFLTLSTITKSNVLCNGEDSGLIESIASGGNPSYNYGIVGLPSNSTGIFNNLIADSYVLTVTDDNGCVSDNQTIDITEPNTLNANINSYSDVTCNGYADGSIDLNANGGTLPYIFNWNNGSDLEDLNNIPADFYFITVVDGNGCEATTSITISESEEVVADWIIISPGIITNNTILPQASPFDIKFVDLSSYANSDLTQWWIDNQNMTDSLYQDTSLEMIEFSFVEMGEHNVVMYAVNDVGCFDTISFSFIVQGLEEFDAFSPNGDNINDYFYFKNHGLSDLSASIFNRWGEKIYEMDSTDDKWDGISLNGQEVPSGVYFYVVDAKGADGTPYQSKGSVSLFR
jgi:gliding motility-associated-like protein